MKKNIIFAGPERPCMQQLVAMHDRHPDADIDNLLSLIKEGRELPPVTFIVNEAYCLVYVYAGTAFNNGDFNQNVEFLSTVLTGLDFKPGTYQSDDWEAHEDILYAAIRGAF